MSNSVPLKTQRCQRKQGKLNLLTTGKDQAGSSAGAGAVAEGDEEEDDLEAMKKKLEQMEEEAAKLNEMKEDLDKQLGSDGKEEEEEAATDDKSVYVGQVDYDATPEELQAFFQTCGTIERVTIVCDTYTRRSKGYAYIEFAEAEAAIGNATGASALRAKAQAMALAMRTHLWDTDHFVTQAPAPVRTTRIGLTCD